MTSPISCPAGTCALSEAVSNTRAAAEANAMVNVIEAVAAVLDMSNPDHEAFADSAADCLDALLALEPEIRRMLDAVVEPSGARNVGANIAHSACLATEPTSLAATQPITGPIR